MLKMCYTLGMRKSIKDMLEKLHDSRNISDEDIASRLKVSSMSVYRWRKGDRNPSWLAAREISKIFNVEQKRHVENF